MVCYADVTIGNNTGNNASVASHLNRKIWREPAFLRTGGNQLIIPLGTNTEKLVKGAF